MHSYNKMNILYNTTQSLLYWYLKQDNFIDTNRV